MGTDALKPTATPAAPAYVPLSYGDLAKGLAAAGVHLKDYKSVGQIEPLVRAIEALVVARMRGQA